MQFQGLKNKIFKRRALIFIFLSIFGSLIIYLDIQMLNLLNIFMTFIFLFVLPGLVILINYFEEINIERFLFAIVLSLSFWVFVSLIFIKTWIPLNKLPIAVINYSFVAISLSFYYFRKNFHNKVPNNDDQNEIIKHHRPTLVSHIKFILNSNTFYLLLFLLILSLFISLRNPYVGYDDVWFHMRLTNDFLDNGLISDNKIYFGELSYHFIGSVFSLFSGLDTLNLARFIGIFQLPFGCFLFYCFIKKIIRNQNLSILITFLFTITIFGTILNFSQYWPTALTTFFGLQMYSFFYERFKLTKFNDKFSLKKNRLYYLIQSILILSIIIVHSINALVYLIPLLFSLIIITIQSRKFLKDLIFFSVLFIINLINDFYWTITLTTSKFINYWWVIFIIIPLVGFLFYIFEKGTHKWTYSIDEPSSILFDSTNKAIIIEKKYYRKFIVPLLIIIGPIVYIYLNIKLKGFFPANVAIMAIEVGFFLIIISASIIGIQIYRKYSLIGKLNFLYFTGILVILVILIILQVVHTFIVRMIQLYIPIFFLGLGFYILYNFKYWLNNPRNRKILLVILLTHTLSSVCYQANFSDFITNSEGSFIEQTVFYSNRENFSDSYSTTVLIIGNFHWSYPFNYFFEMNSNPNNASFSYELGYYLHSENHTNVFENGTEINYLQQLYDLNKSDNIYILIGDIDITRGILLLDGKDYGILTHNEFHEYNNLNYLNRIGVSNNKKTLFWIIPEF
ncbi:hypothetical protein DSAG12_01879 [Promethearchaeum syntrophicum]|uniref:Glycosyltransferase RgtA/B/C/D-like domain-containing protein n=1 Tax=Promethearchaeum syntrophicum TaxID=2594042 RepID=A0A5B9DAL8_9ARCH|nr:hypothetical protein [Candidatus Prometheoarchaeum syntrophicum]QEE16051.1 hypothetical protein DSAG12_01879 [Candidatus Prometheoarchaeum syntrophicum]